MTDVWEAARLSGLDDPRGVLEVSFHKKFGEELPYSLVDVETGCSRCEWPLSPEDAARMSGAEAERARVAKAKRVAAELRENEAKERLYGRLQSVVADRGVVEAIRSAQIDQFHVERIIAALELRTATQTVPA